MISNNSLKRKNIFLLPILSALLINLQGFATIPRQSYGLQKQAIKKIQFQSSSCNEEKEEINEPRKTVVLVGCSSEEGNEIYELGSSIRSFLSVQDILEVDGAEASISIDNFTQDKVVVIDYSKFIKETTYSVNELIQSLYENPKEYMIIYINIDPEQSKMSEKSKRIKIENDAFFINYSDYEIIVENEGLLESIREEKNNKWEHLIWELSRIIAQAHVPKPIVGSESNNLFLNGRDTFFVSLSFQQISKIKPFIQGLCADNDALEFRCDLLSSSSLSDKNQKRKEILKELQLLRYLSKPHSIRAPMMAFGSKVLENVLPIVYTVRSKGQAGAWPDDEIMEMFELLELGLRNGVEILDIESNWKPHVSEFLLKCLRYKSFLLGSFHSLSPISDQEAIDAFQMCTLKNDGRGAAHGAKLVLSIDEKDGDPTCAFQAGKEAQLGIPSISLVLGKHGQYSRIINRNLTPTTHESLPFTAAPGQLTTKEIMSQRIEQKLLQPKEFCILGHQISYSVSPEMHNAAFEACGLPHIYTRFDVETVEEFVNSELFTSKTKFGGASVTIPHKQSIIPFLNELSPAAKEIGSVNTIIPIVNKDENENLAYYGDNTDWKGIVNPIERRLLSVTAGADTTTTNSKPTAALIIGGGGTARAAAYSCQYLGLTCLYWNRTPSKVVDLQDAFGGFVLTDLDQALQEKLKEFHIQVVISTLPAAAEFELPEFIYQQSLNSKLILLDVNYKPYNTKLLLQAQKFNALVIRGSEMLWEQGVGQFELWNKRKAPYGVMKEVVLKNCLPQDNEK